MLSFLYNIQTKEPQEMYLEFSSNLRRGIASKETKTDKTTLENEDYRSKTNKKGERREVLSIDC